MKNLSKSRTPDVRSPRQIGDYLDRDVDCQEALEIALLAVINDAQHAGWSELESIQAAETLLAGLKLVATADGSA